MSLRTSCWLLPQKEQYSSLPPSPSPLRFSVIQSPRMRTGRAVLLSSKHHCTAQLPALLNRA